MMTVRGFQILPLCMPLAVIRMHSSCYGQTIGRNLMVNVLEALDGFVAVCLLTALMIPSIGMNSVYIANVMNSIFSILYLAGYAILKIRRIPRKMEEFMAIPPDFGVPEEKRIDRTVRTMDDVISISEAVQRFCLEQGIGSAAGLFRRSVHGGNGRKCGYPWFPEG